MNSRPIHPRQFCRRQRHGAIFIVALGIIVILSGLVLVYAQSMRTEALASANRLSYAQADAVEQGAERWALAEAESYPGDSITMTQIPAEALQVGEGYFWVLTPNQTSDQSFAFGFTDEAGKININQAGSAAMQNLPNMTEDVTDPMVDWRSDGSAPKPAGAESDYYENLQPEGYQCKNVPFETIEELMLVKNETAMSWPLLLYGYDLNHNGVVEDAERSAAGTANLISSGSNESRGIFNYITCYSKEPNTTINGGPRANVNSRDYSLLRQTLGTVLSQSRVTAIIQATRQTAAASGRTRPFRSLGQFYQASTMTPTEFGLVYDLITATGRQTLTGMVNVNTAPAEVFLCLPNLTQGDADTLVSSRQGADPTNYAWIFSTLSPDKAAGIAGRLTVRSYFYSADIVAVSGDGRAFKRVRIVIDAEQTPAKIVYRKDLTSLGWPLAQQIRDSMRAGKGIGYTPSSTGGSSVLQH